LSSHKIKVFLSGIVNSTNAQNLNCLALAKHLDPEKFEVRALTIYSGDLHSTPTPTTYTYPIRYPAKVWHPIQLMRGILWSDVAYLCKPEYWKWQRLLIRVFHKKAFKTIEGAFIGTNIDKALALKSIAGSKKALLESLTFTGNTYSITEAMKSVNEKAIGLKTKEKVLYLGAETEQFRNDIRREKLTDVAIIGGNLFYKGLNDFFELAKRFPQLIFHVIGSGMGKVNPEVEVERLGLKNIVCHGSLSHTELAEALKGIQLHIFPSRAEGFPKVTLETAAAGVPSLVYDDYGAGEWIKDGESGFVVKTIEDMVGVVQRLISEPALLQKVSEGARAMAKRFDWKVLVKEWERVIEELDYGR